MKYHHHIFQIGLFGKVICYSCHQRSLRPHYDHRHIVTRHKLPYLGKIHWVACYILTLWHLAGPGIARCYIQFAATFAGCYAACHCMLAAATTQYQNIHARSFLDVEKGLTLFHIS